MKPNQSKNFIFTPVELDFVRRSWKKKLLRSALWTFVSITVLVSGGIGITRFRTIQNENARQEEISAISSIAEEAFTKYKAQKSFEAMEIALNAKRRLDSLGLVNPRLNGLLASGLEQIPKPVKLNIPKTEILVEVSEGMDYGYYYDLEKDEIVVRKWMDTTCIYHIDLSNIVCDNFGGNGFEVWDEYSFKRRFPEFKVSPDNSLLYIRFHGQASVFPIPRALEHTGLIFRLNLNKDQTSVRPDASGILEVAFLEKYSSVAYSDSFLLKVSSDLLGKDTIYYRLPLGKPVQDLHFSSDGRTLTTCIGDSILFFLIPERKRLARRLFFPSGILTPPLLTELAHYLGNGNYILSHYLFPEDTISASIMNVSIAPPPKTFLFNVYTQTIKRVDVSEKFLITDFAHKWPIDSGNRFHFLVASRWEPTSMLPISSEPTVYLWDLRYIQRIEFTNGFNPVYRNIAKKGLFVIGTDRYQADMGKFIVVKEMVSGRIVQIIETPCHYADYKITPDQKYVYAISDCKGKQFLWPIMLGNDSLDYEWSVLGDIILTRKHIIDNVGREYTIHDKYSGKEVGRMDSIDLFNAKLDYRSGKYAIIERNQILVLDFESPEYYRKLDGDNIFDFSFLKNGNIIFLDRLEGRNLLDLDSTFSIEFTVNCFSVKEDRIMWQNKVHTFSRHNNYMPRLHGDLEKLPILFSGRNHSQHLSGVAFFSLVSGECADSLFFRPYWYPLDFSFWKNAQFATVQLYDTTEGLGGAYNMAIVDIKRGLIQYTDPSDLLAIGNHGMRFVTRDSVLRIYQQPNKSTILDLPNAFTKLIHTAKVRFSESDNKLAISYGKNDSSEEVWIFDARNGRVLGGVLPDRSLDGDFFLHDSAPVIAGFTQDSLIDVWHYPSGEKIMQLDPLTSVHGTLHSLNLKFRSDTLIGFFSVLKEKKWPFHLPSKSNPEIRFTKNWILNPNRYYDEARSRMIHIEN